MNKKESVYYSPEEVEIFKKRSIALPYEIVEKEQHEVVEVWELSSLSGMRNNNGIPTQIGIDVNKKGQESISLKYTLNKQEQTEKQIEAFLGLVEAYDDLSMTNIEHSDTKVIVERIAALHEPLKALTQILQPYLNGEKL
tara:strand:+ start:135 stop:554 length:420 start_codon:yes stop_codon:yes gene_type:complete